MGTQTVGTQRNMTFTVFNNAQANGDSSVFALFSKPIEPHYITFLPTFPASVTAARVDVYLGTLGPAPNPLSTATDSTKLAPSINWGASEGHTAASGVPVRISGIVAQFVKFTISGYSGPGVATISNVQSTGTQAVITAAAHGFAVGDTVTVAAVTNTTVNGTFVITAKTTNTFTYALVAAVANASDTGTATDLSGLSATAIAA
jgi:hypothetical protein